jgi:hypothetical protein
MLAEFRHKDTGRVLVGFDPHSTADDAILRILFASRCFVLSVAATRISPSTKSNSECVSSFRGLLMTVVSHLGVSPWLVELYIKDGSEGRGRACER